MKRGRWIAVLAAGLLGCSEEPVLGPEVVAGVFQGVTAEGRPIVLAVEQDGQSLRGRGSIDGQPVVIAGPVTWAAVASLSHADGSFASVRLSRGSGDGLVLEGLEEQPVVLDPGGAPVAAAPGPFAGDFRLTGSEAPFARATLVQSGALIAGVGWILGQPVGISGRVTGAGEARGVITFADESHVRFSAELAGDDLTVSGLGGPVVLERQ